MCDKVSRNLLFQQNGIDLMISRNRVDTVMYMYEHAWTLNLCPGYTVSCIFGTNVFILYVCLIAELNNWTDKWPCILYKFSWIWWQLGVGMLIVGCFFQFLIFFQQEFCFELHAGNLFAIKEERRIYCSNATYVLLSQLSPYSTIPLSDLSHVT